MSPSARSHAAPSCCTPGCHPCRPVAPGITRPCPVGLRLCCVALLLAPADCAFLSPRPPPLAVAVSKAPAPQRADLSPFAWPPPPLPFLAAVAAHTSAAVLAAPVVTPNTVQACPHRVARRDHNAPLLLSSRRGSLLPPYLICVLRNRLVVQDTPLKK
ncbi:hypothetical protein Taro_037245 [Colocasia esculenta]|uniref:Uncharacterized protein n=1 Tax=Colocasia esculenta TaxID=4460 RepID=A0A843WK96_COLES|nr:hypothetical protein [Colocasia esculenta]